MISNYAPFVGASDGLGASKVHNYKYMRDTIVIVWFWRQ